MLLLGATVAVADAVARRPLRELQPGAAAPPPIDLVVAWFREPNQKEWPEVAARCPNAEPSRTRDSGELLTNILLARRNLPWLRTIWVLTNGESPCFSSNGTWANFNKDKSAPRIRSVSHKDIWPPGALNGLPTYNSMAIEANMHRIDGLAEHFIYANDDMFLLEPLEVRRVSWSLPSRYLTRASAKMPAMSPGDAECGLINASDPDAASLAPWQCATCRPTVYAMGLQKAGTTFMSSSLAEALQTKYTPEAVYTCCRSHYCLPDNCTGFGDEQDVEYLDRDSRDSGRAGDHWPGVDFGGDMAQYFARCGPLSLDETGPYGVIKADDMLPYAVPFHRFVGHEHLSLRLLFRAPAPAHDPPDS
jgi:hypothetical protein